MRNACIQGDANIQTIVANFGAGLMEQYSLTHAFIGYFSCSVMHIFSIWAKESIRKPIELIAVMQVKEGHDLDMMVGVDVKKFGSEYFEGKIKKKFNVQARS